MANEGCLICKCGSECTHLIGIIEVETNDDYETTGLIIDKKYSIEGRMKYKYRSQGNIHLLFRCEEGMHHTIKSFDGHKGTVYIDDNELMTELSKYLDEVYSDESHSQVLNHSFSMDFQLLGNIEKFVSSRDRSF